jgi:hypothetical protein
MKCNKENLKLKLQRLSERLKLYYNKENALLTQNSVVAYGVGNMNLRRDEISLADIQKEIKNLENQITQLEKIMNGCSSPKLYGAVPQDY